MSTELKQIVRNKYTRIVQEADDNCCSSSCCSDGAETIFSEDYTQLEGYNPDADLNLGCGLPTAYARIKPGQVVLDLGSGAGNDVFIARSLTGKTGKVIGIDFTEAMIAKARANQKKLGYSNVEFVYGDIENMPIPDASVDVVISNCVMNLVPDKVKAYAEVYRVLKPGGHFSISDIVTNGDLPDPILRAAALYAGCVSGAMQKQAYLDIITRSGFQNLTIDKERQIELPDELLLEYLKPEELEDFRQSGASIYSINVYAEK